MNRLFCILIAALSLYIIHMYALEEEHPAKRQRTEHTQESFLSFLVADEQQFVAPMNIVTLSPYIKNIVDTGSRTINLQQFPISASTLQYYLECLKGIANGIDIQKKSADFPSIYLLQRSDGILIAKNILPIIKSVIKEISEEDFINVIKLSLFTETYFLLNALCHIYVEKQYASKSYQDFKNDTQKLMNIFEAERIFRFLKKHAYIQKVLPWPTNVKPYEISIGDYITLFPNHGFITADNRRFTLIDKISLNNLNNTQMHITSLDGMHLLDLKNINTIEIQSDFLVAQYYDPLFPVAPFRNAHQLRYLIIKNTPLYSLEESFLQGLAAIETINLQNTKLIDLSKNFLDPVKKTIEKIYLQNNEIRELDQEIFYEASRYDLDKVYLANNPICKDANDSIFHLEPAELETHTYIDCETLSISH